MWNSYILRNSRKNWFYLHDMRNNGSIILRNRVESIFGYLAHHRACFFLLLLKYLTVCSNGGEMFERQQASELSKLALNAVLDYLCIFYHGVKLAFSQFE